MNLYDETLIRFDDTGKNIYSNFTQTISRLLKRCIVCLRLANGSHRPILFVRHLIFFIPGQLTANQAVDSIPEFFTKNQTSQYRALFFFALF
jgi:hypothetical protein